MPLNWRDLPPIDEDEHAAALERLLDERMPSQTFLAHRDRCHRSAFLYLKHAGGPGSHPLNRGSIFHLVVEELTREEIIGRDEHEVPPEVAKDRLNEVLARHPELTVPADERDALRQMIYHWAAGSYFDPSTIVGVELAVELEVGDWIIRGKIDLVEQPTHYLLHVTDYKTQWNMPNAEEFARGGPDTHSFAGDFQTELYALMLAFGHTPDGLTPGEGVDEFRLFQRFPRYLGEEGLFYRDAVITRQQLVDFRFDVEAMLASLERSIDTRKWQPTPGSHCARCPSPYECPLPRMLRADSQAAELDSLEDLERLATSWEFTRRSNELLKKRLKAAAQRLGVDVVYAGSDIGLKFVPKEAESIKSKPKLRQAIEGAALYGHGLAEDGTFPWNDHVTYSQGTEFARRRLPPKTQPREDDADHGND